MVAARTSAWLLALSAAAAWRCGSSTLQCKQGSPQPLQDSTPGLVAAVADEEDACDVEEGLQVELLQVGHRLIELKADAAAEVGANATADGGANATAGGGANATAGGGANATAEGGGRGRARGPAFSWLDCLLPLGAGLGVSLGVYAYRFRFADKLPEQEEDDGTDAGRDKRLACMHLELTNALAMLMFALIIPDSYSLALAVGEDVSFSGLLVGLFMGAACLGSLLYWLLSECCRDLVWQYFSLCLQLGSLLMLAGAALHIWVALGISDAAYTAASPLHLSTLLVFSRLICGLGGGVCFGIVYTTGPLCAPEGKLQEVAASLTMGGYIALGMGPVLAELLHLVDFSPQGFVLGAPDHFAVIAAGGAGLCIGSLYAVIDSCPNFEDVPPKPEFPEEKEEEVTVDPNVRHLFPNIRVRASNIKLQRWLMIASFYVLTTLAAFSLSSLEVASILLLESEYGWAQPFTGLVVGGTFLLCVPLKVWLDEITQDSASEQTRLVLAIAAFSCIMLFNFDSSGARVRALMLLVGDAFFFPSMVLVGNLTQNLMYSHAKVSETASITQMLNFTSSMARCCGPWASRFLIQSGSQNIYAFSQVALCGLCLAASFGSQQLVPSYSISYYKGGG